MGAVPPTTLEPTVKQLGDRLAEANGLSERIQLIARLVAGRIAFSTSLGIEDQAILHAIAEGGAAVDIFTLDTGRLFLETIDTLAASERQYGMGIRVLAPSASDVETLVVRDGVLGFRHSIDARKACCHVRKVAPLRRGLAGAAAWITGLRREQSSGRADVPFAAWDREHGLIKLNPLADWSLDRLDAYVAAHGIPLNPLHGRGFPSVGCQPCTRAIRPGEDIRAGRWWWESKDGKECGLHASPRGLSRSDKARDASIRKATAS
ncbi:MAG: phosphoadenylyl-sulfate reductase [Hyphomicrobiaceae bacterium]|nr:MAG: phosphoadenylyl-sulfate reductase [Hyphomicrobiaceae bacterium]